MNTVKDITVFINDYLDVEFVCHISRWSSEISNEKHNENREKLKLFYHSNIGFGNLYPRAKDFSERYSHENLIKKKSEAGKRTLFMIKVYEDSELGGNLRAIVKDNILYRCYVGHADNAMPNSFSQCFFIANTDKGLKIIYDIYFYKGKWEHSGALQHLQVIKCGKLTETLRLVAPTDEKSLADYNSEIETPIIQGER